MGFLRVKDTPRNYALTINNHFKCRYRKDCNLCSIEKTNIQSLLEILIVKGVITETYKYNF